MAAARGNIVDTEMCYLLGELKVDINARVTPDYDFNHVRPIICDTYFMNSKLVFQIVLRHSPWDDKIEAYLETILAQKESLTFKIKYGFLPFRQYKEEPQIFICTAVNRLADTYKICPFGKLVEILVENEEQMLFQHAEFVSTIIISLCEIRPIPPEYKIPTVNDRSCDHRLICEGRRECIKEF